MLICYILYLLFLIWILWFNITNETDNYLKILTITSVVIIILFITLIILKNISIILIDLTPNQKMLFLSIPISFIIVLYIITVKKAIIMFPERSVTFICLELLLFPLPLFFWRIKHYKQ